MLGLVFGATTLAVSTVLAAFMGGLALGSALAGKLSHRIKKPLSTYGVMEIGIAVYALLDVRPNGLRAELLSQRAHRVQRHVGIVEKLDEYPNDRIALR